VQPLITQYNITGPQEKQNGLGDAVVSTFLSPSGSKNGFTWGAGPVFLVPDATEINWHQNNLAYKEGSQPDMYFLFLQRLIFPSFAIKDY